MYKLRKENNLSYERIRLAAEASFLLGFQSENSTFPVISEKGTVTIPYNKEELKALWKLHSPAPSHDYQEALPYECASAPDLSVRKKKGLECMFKDGMFMEDTNKDTFPDLVKAKFILPDEIDDYMLEAVCSLAFRFGMETTGFSSGILAPDGYSGPAVVFSYSHENAVRLKDSRILVTGEKEELVSLVNRFCETFPLINDVQTFEDTMEMMCRSFGMNDADGQLAYLDTCKDTGQITVFHTPDLKDEQKALYPSAEFINHKDGTVIYDITHEYEWEADVFRRILEQEVYPLLHEGDVLTVDGAVSEGYDVRNRFINDIMKKAEECHASCSKVRIVNAYKQGLSWLKEYVIPKLKEIPSDDLTVTVAFRPFLPEGQKEWKDENGATPSYNNAGAGDENQWFDLPIRWLQELYPAEDILCEELQIAKEKITFKAYEGEEDITYLVTAFDHGHEVIHDTYRVHHAERPYLDDYPEMGKVHPSTGFIRVLINEQEIVNRRIVTDLEKIWDTYQKEILPSVIHILEDKDGELRADAQPFFQELKLEINISEAEERLHFREDMISPLDALHEDLYFTGSDYFRQYGLKHHSGMLDAPGLILPVIHNKEGAPSFHVTLSERKRECPAVIKEGKVLCESSSCRNYSAYISGVSLQNGKYTVEITTEGTSDSMLSAYAELMEKEQLNISEYTGHCDAMMFTQIDKTIPVKEKVFLRDQSINDIDLMEHTLIGYDDYLKIMEKIKYVKGVSVWTSAVSYTGRVQYSLWLRPEREGYLSLTKYLSSHLCEHINARHHANEVSSTNANFMLLKELLTNEKYKELPEKICLVMTPVENTDGTAIHYELQKEHPYWKLHVARFNSLGKEYFHDSFNPDTIHTTALGFGHLYTRFLPDLCTDNHGVPSHEWEQQFSGYTSPSYKGFWLPRSLLYGYYWYVDDACYADNVKAAKAMEDIIADAIEKEPEMCALNREWMHQFEVFAHQWMPGLFPADYYRNMIDYWIRHTASMKNRYPACRYPWITTVSYTSEVADETAQSEYLHLCARAHAVHDLAVIDRLMNAKYEWHCSLEETKDGLSGKYLRKRPFIL